MFTGIVQSLSVIHSLEAKAGLVTFSVDLSGELAEGINIGASIAINGICLTVTSIELDESANPLKASVSFDMMQQTLDLTNAASFADGVMVNVERSAKAMQEVGGHIVSGHIDAQATISAIEESENNTRIRFSYPKPLAKYLLDKGFVALNGCSLTIAAVDSEACWLEVCFIPETLRATVFGQSKVGDKVNLEVERQTQAIVDTVERVLAQQLEHR